MNRIHINEEYAPWSAEFIDGTYASRLTDRTLKFSEAVTPKLPLLYTFYIHIDYDFILAVRLTDGLFYCGSRPGDPSGWFPAPGHEPGLQYTLIYSRQCGGNFINGKIESAVLGYTLGWKCQQKNCCMKIELDGKYKWV